MKSASLFLLALYLCARLSNGFIITHFPDGTIIYKAIGARITSVSSIQPFERKDSERIKFTFSGKWELNPDLQGVHVTPEAGVVIIADTVKEIQELTEIHSMLSSLKQKTLNIYILSGSRSGAINSNGVTYTGLSDIKFELNENPETNALANGSSPRRWLYPLATK